LSVALSIEGGIARHLTSLDVSRRLTSAGGGAV
jgi:hypothetical protein